MGSLDEPQVRRAVGALLKHIKLAAVGNPRLVEEGQVILAQVSLHKIPGDVKVKPIPIAIPHPLRQRDDCDMCLIVKDDAKAWLKEMVEKEPVEGLTKIIKLQNLRSQYSEFKDRRKLLNEFDLFLADDRILPMLTKALGKTFLKVKKQPVPVRLERKSSLASQIARARDSAFLCGSHGDCWAVKLATTAMTEDQVVENLMAGIAAVVDKIPRKWKNVKGINIKCSDSVALPVYSFVGDIPPAPPAATKDEAGEGEGGVEGEGEKRPGSGKAEKRRKPRPLIRQQLNKIKEDTKAEKALAAGAAASGSAKKSKAKKQAVSEVGVPAAGGKEGGESVGGEGGGSLKKKRKSLVATTAAVDDASTRVKSGKRRRS